MYTLYYAPGACSLATQTVLHELDLPVSIVDKNTVANFTQLNPAGTVPVLKTGDVILNEGAAILLHLLDSKANHLMPGNDFERQQVIEAIMFANATVHPAYGRLFFGANAIEDKKAQQSFFNQSADAINKLWRIVNDRIGDNDYLLGDRISPADILLTVYSDWGQYFPVSIEVGTNSKRMIANVKARPSFQKAIAAEAQRAA